MYEIRYDRRMSASDRRNSEGAPCDGTENRQPGARRATSSSVVWVGKLAINDSTTAATEYLMNEYENVRDRYNEAKSQTSRVQNITFLIAAISLCLFFLGLEGATLSEIHFDPAILKSVNIKFGNILYLVPFVLAYLACYIYRASVAEEGCCNGLEVVRRELKEMFGFTIEMLNRDEMKKHSDNMQLQAYKTAFTFGKKVAKRVQNIILVLTVGTCYFLIGANGVFYWEAGIAKTVYLGAGAIVTIVMFFVIVGSIFAKRVYKECREAIRQGSSPRDILSTEEGASFSDALPK